MEKTHEKSVSLICPNCGSDQWEYDKDDPNTLYTCAGCGKVFTDEELTEANKDLLEKESEKFADEIGEKFSKDIDKKLKDAFKGNKYVKIK